MGVHPEIIVIGAGTMGIAATLELARRGKRVLVIDRSSVPNAIGSHHGTTRFFRTAYFEHPDYVPLLVQAREGWARLERDCGERLFEQTGMLLMGPTGGRLVEPTIASAQTHGIEHQTLSHADLKSRYPYFKAPGQSIGVFEPSAGCIACETAISAMARLARQHGATIMEHTPVLDWSADASGVRVRTQHGTIEAERLVLCQGAWSGDLAQDLGTELRVTRQVMFWLQPPAGGPSTAPELPVWAMEAEGDYFFGFPQVLGEQGLKTCSHTPGAVSEPASLDREVYASDERPIREFLQRHAPVLDTPTMDATVCMYSMTPDEHFVIDRHPRHENVVVACGFSGHGFKFAPVVGELISSAASSSDGVPTGFLSGSRFRRQ